MTIPSVHTEAKLHAFRKTKDGIVVSFVLHPEEIPDCLSLDPLGSRYILALAKIGDDEQPVEPPQRAASEKALLKAPRPFHTLPVGSQAALACKEASFRAFLLGHIGRVVANEQEAGACLRQHFAVNSRADIPPGVWAEFYSGYEQWAGKMAERHG